MADDYHYERIVPNPFKPGVEWTADGLIIRSVMSRAEFARQFTRPDRRALPPDGPDIGADVPGVIASEDSARTQPSILPAVGRESSDDQGRDDAPSPTAQESPRRA